MKYVLQYRTVTLFVALALVAWGCTVQEPPSSGDQGSVKREGPLKITCTIGMIGDVAAQIGGEHVRVTALMGPGVDPHLYKASAGDLSRLQDADLVLYNGLHLEGRMADVLVKFAQRVPTFQVTDTIDPARLREPPEFAGNYDPHVWFDVSLWKNASERILAILTEAYPEQKDYFSERANAYFLELDTLHRYAKDQIQTIPAENRVLVTAHDAFGYFGRAYGLEVLGIQGISTSSEYGLQDINTLINTLVEKKIGAVFVESSVSQRSIEALIAGAEAQGHTVKLGGTLFSDAMGEADTAEGTYVGMVRHNVDTIVEALGNDPKTQ